MADIVETTCCIVGGGPAGIILGYLLARAGVRVTVLEKHADFFRDFRGDTVHPSTLEVLNQLGLLPEFLALPHQEVRSLGLVLGGTTFDVADFRHVPATCKFIALMPQWDFLNFIARHASAFPSFRLLMEHEAIELTQDGDRISGVVAKTRQRTIQIRADLVIGCDGRHALTRNAAHLRVIEHGVPIDVLWFRFSRQPDDPADVFAHVNYGKALILINRSDYFQAGLIIAKGSYDELKDQGLEAFRTNIRRIAPFVGDRVNELHTWNDIKILTVQINRLAQWHTPGLLCIGDAAHAMSPAGGVGINLAIQDAVAAANRLTRPLLNRRITNADLAAVQRRRTFPTRATQAAQIRAHRAFTRVFQNPGPAIAPWQLKLALRIPGIQRAIGYGVGMGVRPERVRTTPAKSACTLNRKPLAVAAGLALAAGALGFAAWKLCQASRRTP